MVKPSPLLLVSLGKIQLIRMATGLPRQAIRLLRGVTYPETSSILLQVHVKTGVKPPKENSVISIQDDQVKLQVQSPGVNDRANIAVKLLLSKVDSPSLSTGQKVCRI